MSVTTPRYGAGKRAREAETVDGHAADVAGPLTTRGYFTTCYDVFDVRGKTTTYRPTRGTRRKLIYDAFYKGRVTDPLFATHPFISYFYSNLGPYVKKLSTGPYQTRGVACEFTEGLTIGGSAGSTKLPLHLFDLTSRNDASVAQQKVCGWQAYQDGVDNNIKFLNLDGLKADGVTTNSYMQVYKASDANCQTAQHLFKATLLRNASVELLLCGMSNQPTTFYIDLVQFPDQIIGLPSNFVTNCAPDAGATTQRNALIWRLLHRMVVHPCARQPQQLNIRPAMRVLASKAITIAPTDTGADNAVGVLRHCKFDFKLDHLCAWAYQQNPNPGFSGDLTLPGAVNKIDTTVYTPQFASFNYLADPSHRVYLMIRASQQVAGNTATSSAGLVPTYDFRIVTNHDCATATNFNIGS